MKIKSILTWSVLSILLATNLQAQTALQIIKKSDDLYRGQSSYSEMKITSVRPKWSKEMIIKSWSLGSDYATSLVMSPAKEKGTVFLKRETEVWNYLPSLERSIKLPPSMMMQGWMGTDLTNDDMVKQSSIVVDYEHKILGEEEIEGLKCWKLELIPKENAPVVWGKVLVWIDKADHIQLKTEFYDEDEFLINQLIGSNIKSYGNKKLPSKMEFIPVEKKGQKTIIEYLKWEFDIDVPESYFTTRYMKRLK